MENINIDRRKDLKLEMPDRVLTADIFKFKILSRTPETSATTTGHHHLNKRFLRSKGVLDAV